MNEGVILLVIIILMGLIGVTIYLVKDYKEYKTQTDGLFTKQQENISSVQKSVSNEGSARLSNLKFVVDQVNSVNMDIDNEMTSNVTRLDTKLAGVSNVQQQWIRGMDTFFRFSSNATSKSLYDYNNSYATPDLELIRRTSMLGGVNIQNIDSANVGKPAFQVCGTDSTGQVNSRCIKIPDTNGNTFITGLRDNSKVIINTNSIFTGTTMVGIGHDQSDALTVPLEIKLPSSATSSLNIKSSTGANLFSISGTGEIVFPNNHKISMSTAAGASKLVIDTGSVAGNVEINGNLKVTGNVIRNGSTTIA
jgi:hypothetical protein